MRTHNHAIQVFFSLLVCALATSCIPIENLGEYWDKGVVDHRLEGHWRKAGVEHRSQDQYVSFKLDGKSYRCITHAAEEVPSPDGMPDLPMAKTEARTLRVGKHRFLMVRTELPELPPVPTSQSAPNTKPADRGTHRVMSGLVRYEFVGEQLVSYTLDEQVLSEAISTKRLEGQLPGKDDYVPSWVNKLDQKTLDLIVKWADDPQKWKETGRYNRIADVEKALAESRTYPASSQTAANTTVDIALPDLKYLAEDKNHVLLRHLEASPEWEVLNERDEIVCQKAGTSNGYESNWDSSSPKSERYQIGCFFRFGNKAGGPARWGGRLKVVFPGAGRTQLALKSSDQGIESYLAVGQKGLWFEFFEQSQVEERRHTQKALVWVKNFLADVRTSEADIKELGYAPKLIPADAIRKGKPSIEIVDKSTGFYEVRAWINPGADGRPCIRLFDKNSNTRFPEFSPANLEPPLFAGSKRRVAWSNDLNTLFLYKENIFAKSKTDQTFETKVELWFKPTGSGKEFKLGETTHTFVTSKPIPH